jgi:hypothetical protein
VTWDEKLQAIRDELRWIASECMRGDDDEVAHAALGASMVIGSLKGKLHEYGLDEADWNRDAQRHPEGQK